jgi:hypothetical protein
MIGRVVHETDNRVSALWGEQPATNQGGTAEKRENPRVFVLGNRCSASGP